MIDVEVLTVLVWTRMILNCFIFPGAGWDLTFLKALFLFADGFFTGIIKSDCCAFGERIYSFE